MSSDFDQLLAEHPELADLASPTPQHGYVHAYPSSTPISDGPDAPGDPAPAVIEFPSSLLSSGQLLALMRKVGQFIQVSTAGPSGIEHHAGVLLKVEQCGTGCHLRVFLRQVGIS